MVFITFGAGSLDIQGAARRLEKQAVESGFFDEVRVFSAESLPEDLVQLFSPLEFSKIRGFGYWAWKPFIIRQTLATLVDGDVLIYMDAGCEINIRGRDRYTYYLDYVARNEVLVFPMPYQHRFWVKPHPSLRTKNLHYFRNQVSAAFFMVRAGDLSRKLVDSWFETSVRDSGSAITDKQTGGDSPPVGFIEHRHDQAVLSHFVYELSVPVLDRDETYHAVWHKAREYPFFALRNKSPHSQLRYRLSAPYVRAFLYVLSPLIDQDYFMGNLKLLVKNSLKKIGYLLRKLKF